MFLSAVRYPLPAHLNVPKPAENRSRVRTIYLLGHRRVACRKCRRAPAGRGSRRAFSLSPPPEPSPDPGTPPNHPRNTRPAQAHPDLRRCPPTGCPGDSHPFPVAARPDPSETVSRTSQAQAPRKRPGQNPCAKTRPPSGLPGHISAAAPPERRRLRTPPERTKQRRAPDCARLPATHPL